MDGKLKHNTIRQNGKNKFHIFTPQVIFLIIISVTTSLLYVTAYFIDTNLSTTNEIIHYIIYWALASIANALLLTAISANKYVFYVLFPLYNLAGTILSYAKIMYGATLTPMLIDASLHNDIQTTSDFFTIPSVLCIILWVITTTAFIIYRSKITFSKPLILALVSIPLFIGCVHITDGAKLYLPDRFPYNVYYKTKDYIILRNNTNKILFDPDERSDTAQRTDSITTILIIGESLRADHLSINGYDRETTPNLAKERNIISFPHIYSEYTYTNRSLPHILTRADSANQERAFSEKSFISSFNKDNFCTYWIANQDIADTYYQLAHECDEIRFVHPGNSVYFSNKWYDNEMIPTYLDILNDSCPRKMIIFHTIGNHWYYNNHFDTNNCKFTPITTNKDTRLNTPEQIINSYDNVVCETDKFVFNVISAVKSSNAIVIYLSDHGEALGENGKWLHANESNALKNPACFIWYSDIYKQNYPEKVNAVIKNKNKRYSTDFLYHSILSCSNIGSKTIDEKLNIFK